MADDDITRAGRRLVLAAGLTIATVAGVGLVRPAFANQPPPVEPVGTQPPPGLPVEYGDSPLGTQPPPGLPVEYSDATLGTQPPPVKSDDVRPLAAVASETPEGGAPLAQSAVDLGDPNLGPTVDLGDPNVSGANEPPGD